MEIRPAVMNSIPLITLAGRWDGYGASQFEKEIPALAERGIDVIVDLSGVNYLSSSGIRSLLKLENALRPKGAQAILVKPSPFVREVLNCAGLLRQIRVAGSTEEAWAMAAGSSPEAEAPFQQIIGGREYLLKRLGDNPCALDLWGDPPGLPDKIVREEDLEGIPLRDLDYSFGIGGFGDSRQQASASLGEYVSLPGIAGVVPADGNGFPDLLTAREQPDAMVYVAAAAGFSCPPSIFAEVRSKQPVGVQDLANDLSAAVEAFSGTAFPALGFLLLAAPSQLTGSVFGKPIPTEDRFDRTRGPFPAAAVLVVGIVSEERALPATSGPPLSAFAQFKGSAAGGGRFFHGHALVLPEFDPYRSEKNIDRIVRSVAESESTLGAVHIEPETAFIDPRIWIYPLAAARPGMEKLLQIELADGADEFPEEWETITRRICRDARRVVLTPLHGGFMSKTFHVAGYDTEGRRMLPTVLKIGPTALTRREEEAHRNFVEKYILNNSTSIMGSAACGDWAGLRYNFVGITGPGSRIRSLRDHYLSRPLKELVPLFETIFTNILKPWHGQPRWENFHPYEEHNPLRLFPDIIENAERHLGISPDNRIIECTELGCSLPNPYYFLKHEYPRRKETSLPWYKCVTHGDLNLQNILVDEKENIYIIDFSETRIRSAAADFARMEAQLRFQMTRIETERDLAELLEFELGLAEPSRMSELPPFRYHGSDAVVSKAYEIIRLLRHYADKVTIFEEDPVPYLLALLEWTYPFVSFRDATPLLMRFSACSAAILCRKIIDLT